MRGGAKPLRAPLRIAWGAIIGTVCRSDCEPAARQSVHKTAPSRNRPQPEVRPMQPSPQPDTNTPTAPVSANPGHALGQLAHALIATETYEDPEIRARAARKVEAWAQ